MIKTNAVYTPSLQLVIYSAMSILLFLVLLLRGDSSPGDLVAYITLAGLLPKPIRQLSEVSSTIQKGVSGAESIFEQLDEDIENDSGRVEVPRISGRLEVRELYLPIRIPIRRCYKTSALRRKKDKWSL